MFRIGNGYDVHQLVKGRPLVLGGEEIPFTHGLWGHSDADVLLHALCDALLGAAGLRDIGYHFPDTDPQYCGAKSLTLLETTGVLCREKGYLVGNIDVTVIAQKPRLAPYIEKMQKNIASTLIISSDQVNIKATTNEKMGFLGRGEGIAALAVALLTRSHPA